MLTKHTQPTCVPVEKKKEQLLAFPCRRCQCSINRLICHKLSQNCHRSNDSNNEVVEVNNNWRDICLITNLNDKKILARQSVASLWYQCEKHDDRESRERKNRERERSYSKRQFIFLFANISLSHSFCSYMNEIRVVVYSSKAIM